jgi:hypothetical protein
LLPCRRSAESNEFSLLGLILKNRFILDRRQGKIEPAIAGDPAANPPLISQREAKPAESGSIL